MADNNLMTHLVAGYPTLEESKKAALAMVEGGASYLEIQFPFSDPIADGPLIQGACTESLNNGFTVEDGFSLLNDLSHVVKIPLFLMTYANLVIASGIDNFVKKSVENGASGLIIPDLPYDYDEGLYDAGKKMNIPVVPVVVPGISQLRLNHIQQMKPEYIYTAIRKGITGAKTSIDSQTVSFLSSLSKDGVKILAGFGIRDKEQVDALSPYIHSAVIGSALVEIIKNSSETGQSCSDAVRDFVLSLC